MSERLALDTRLWRTPQQAEQDFASYLLEQKKAPLEEKINYLELSIAGFEEIKKAMLIKTETDKLELNAVERLIKWAKKSPEGTSIWISPPYPNPDQDEARFIVYEIIQREEKKVALHCVCGLQDTQTCLFIARQLSAFRPDGLETNNSIDSEEKLRETPIPFTSHPPYHSWIDLLEDLIEPARVWGKIRAGEHIKRKQEALTVSKQVVKNNQGAIFNARTTN